MYCFIFYAVGFTVHNNSTLTGFMHSGKEKGQPNEPFPNQGCVFLRRKTLQSSSITGPAQECPTTVGFSSCFRLVKLHSSWATPVLFVKADTACVSYKVNKTHHQTNVSKGGSAGWWRSLCKCWQVRWQE